MRQGMGVLAHVGQCDCLCECFGLASCREVLVGIEISESADDAVGYLNRIAEIRKSEVSRRSCEPIP